jgi:antirestriction protein ArdC
MKSNSENWQDVYTRITAAIVADLEKGTLPWVRLWSSVHAVGASRGSLRHNGEPYSGINVLSLWASASAQGFSAPIWMTFKQALDLKAHVRKGEKASPVVYANSIRRTENDRATGDDIEREIHFCVATPCSTSSRSKACPRTTTRFRIERGSTCRRASRMPSNSSPQQKER